MGKIKSSLRIKNQPKGQKVATRPPQGSLRIKNQPEGQKVATRPLRRSLRIKNQQRNINVEVECSWTRHEGMYGANYTLRHGGRRIVFQGWYSATTTIGEVIHAVIKKGGIVVPYLRFRGIYVTELHLGQPIVDVNNQCPPEKLVFTNNNDYYLTSDKYLLSFDENGKAFLNPGSIPWSLEDALNGVPVHPGGMPVGVFPSYGQGAPPSKELQNTPENVFRGDDGLLYNKKAMSMFTDKVGRAKFLQFCTTMRGLWKPTMLATSLNQWACR